MFAALNGIAKTLALGRFFSGSTWDSKSSFAAVFNTEPVSVLIYSPAAGEVSLIKLDENLYVPSDGGETFVKLSERIDSIKDGSELSSFVSEISRSPIKGYMIFETGKDASEENLEESFESFASVMTPLKTALFGIDEVKQTNITRSDLIRLWWQLKSLSVNDLNFVETGEFSQEVVIGAGSRVLGVDDVSLHMLFAKYLENEEILRESMEVEIINSSGFGQAGRLAADIAGAVGAKVTSVELGNEMVEETLIIADSDNGYTSSYLARILDCDIKSLPNSEKGKVTVVVGKDFGKYF
jgi:hypothetical protein